MKLVKDYSGYSAGFIQDFLGLDVGIYITAGAIILSGVVSFLILLFQYYEKGKNEKHLKTPDDLQEKETLLESSESD